MEHPLESVAVAEDTWVTHDLVVLIDVKVDVATLDQLHRIEVSLIFMVEVVKIHEVRVREARDRSKLSLEVVKRARIVELELLEREFSIVYGIIYAIDMPHPSCTKLT